MNLPIATQNEEDSQNPQNPQNLLKNLDVNSLLQSLGGLLNGKNEGELGELGNVASNLLKTIILKNLKKNIEILKNYLKKILLMNFIQELKI